VTRPSGILTAKAEMDQMAISDSGHAGRMAQKRQSEYTALEEKNKND
jgi:hypothetical protein